LKANSHTIEDEEKLTMANASSNALDKSYLQRENSLYERKKKHLLHSLGKKFAKCSSLF